MKAVLGVDPGVRGGLVVLDPLGQVALVEAFRPDMTEVQLTDIVGYAALMLKGYSSRACFFERVGYMPTDGGKGAFTFGKIVGLLRGLLLANDVRIIDVNPMTWQSAMGCLTGGNKNVSKKRAQELFPEVKVTHAIADALLISEFGRQRLMSNPRLTGTIPIE